MEKYPETRGKTTIEPGVLINIAKFTTLSVDGIRQMAPGPRPLDRLLKNTYRDGVNIEVENNSVYIDLYVIVKNSADLYKTGQKVQSKVARAITEMVGMEIGHVNVHIEDIDYQSE